MEPRPVCARETIPVLRTGSPRVRRHMRRVVEFEDAPNRDGSRIEREFDSMRPSERRVQDGGSYSFHTQGGNPSPGGASTYHPYGGYTSQAPMSNYGPNRNGPMYPSNVPPTSYPFYKQPVNPLPHAPIYPNYGPTSLFVDSTDCMTPFVCWIEDYPMPDRLKMPSHVGSYDGKGDPDNYLHLLEGAIRI
ncbi:hypothetical protein Tco_1185862 [Tanacetum coccineum]